MRQFLRAALAGTVLAAARHLAEGQEHTLSQTPQAPSSKPALNKKEDVMNTAQTAIQSAEKTVGEIVADDYRTAAVFERHGIDFCCGGKQPVAAACKQRGIDPAAIAQEIEAAKTSPADRSQNYASWSLSFLADYIVNTHHAYLRENMPQLSAYARKIAQVHGPNHPELIEIATIFDKVAADMAAHLREEEEIFFPAIKRVEAAHKAGNPADAKDAETLTRSLDTLKHEHEEIGDATHRIRHLARDYTIPSDACNTFRVTYHRLKEFEDDLHKHVHLENNILFPKALTLR